MGYQLRDQLFACIADDTTILLDARADRYFGLPRNVDVAFQALVTHGPDAEAAGVAIEHLLRIGLLTRVLSGTIEPVQIDPATAELTGFSPRSASLADGALALHHRIAAQILLNLLPLRHVLERIRQAKRYRAATTDRPGELCQQVVAGFHAAERLVSSHDRCLVNSIGLMHALLRGGCKASLVLGVRARPFSAHSWVQHDRTVLNDRLERVRIYTPILVI